SATRLSRRAFKPRYAKPLRSAKIASATSSSTSVKPGARPRKLRRDIAREPREDARRVARLRHGEVDAADHRVRRLAHRLLDGEREPAFLRREAGGGRGREHLARAQLRKPVLGGPGCEEALARIHGAVGRDA